MLFMLIPDDQVDDRLAAGIPAGSDVYTIDRLQSKIEKLRADDDPVAHRIVNIGIWYNVRLGIVKPKPWILREEGDFDWKAAANEKAPGVFRIKDTIPNELFGKSNRGYLPTSRQATDVIPAPPQPKVTAPGPWEPGFYAFFSRHDYERDCLVERVFERDVAMRIWDDLPDETTAVGDSFEPEWTAQNRVVIYAALKLSRDADCLEVLGLHAPIWFDRDWVAGIRKNENGLVYIDGSVACELLGRFDPATGQLTMRFG